jgi:hypothetical protein
MKTASLTALVILSALLAGGPVAPAAGLPFIEVDPASTTSFRERGTHRPFTAVGLNYFDHETGWAPHLWEKYDDQRVRDQLRMVAEQGFNTIRVFITLQAFEQEAGRVTGEGEARFRRMLAVCRDLGIRVIPTGPELWEGAPPWYKGDRFADEPLLAAEESWWREFAGRFADEPVILAWDLANEPAIGWDSPAMVAGWNRWLQARHGDTAAVARAWKLSPDQIGTLGQLPAPPKSPDRGNPRLLEYQRYREHVADSWTARMCAAIRSSDRNHMITVGQIQWASPVLLPSVWHYAGFDLRANARHLDFSTIHFYPLDYPKPCDSPEGVPANRIYLLALLAESSAGKPLMLGEFNWYGGGGLKGESGWELPEMPVEHQVAWCDVLLRASRGRTCGWLNWAFADTVSARDISRWSGCWTSDLKLKPWGAVFGRFAREVAGRPEVARPFPAWLDSVRLDREAALTDPAAGNEYRNRLRAAAASHPAE